MDESRSRLQLVSRVGHEIGKRTRPNKDFLVKSLKEGAIALSHIEQPFSPDPSRKLQVIKEVEVAIKPLRESIIKHSLLLHSDRDVRVLVAICVSEVLRILAADNPPFEDKYIRDIFKLIISMFRELANTDSIYFSKMAKILETVARYKCYLIMMDDGYDLVLEMFNVFFSVAREHHQQSLINDILSIITHILNEEASQPLADVIMQNLVNEAKGATSAASHLAFSSIQSCAEKLEPFICGFLESCFLDRDAVLSELKEFYHEIMFKIFQCAPQMLRRIIPYLTQELLTDQVDVRIKAVNLIGKLLALPEHNLLQKYRDLFVEFLKRFSDKSVEVRVAALQCAKACYMARPSVAESCEVLTALGGRLLDFDDKVRTQAVIIACDLARSNLKFVVPKLVSETTERLRDKKISVRKKALQKLMEVYQDYCNKCSEGFVTISDHFEQIPCKILMLIYDKDCKEIRSQNLELVLADDLFPALLSVKERMRHWIHLFSLFTPPHLKALNSILSQKRRLQTEMQNYLALRKKEKDDGSEEVQKRITSSFMKMSACFPDPTKAEECFHKLNQMKDNNIFNALALLLDETTISNAQATRDKFLKMIGEKHPHFEFLRLLSSKCLFNIFSSEHVSCILDYLLGNWSGNQHLVASSVKLLEVIVSIFPSLLRGSEAKFQLLFEGNGLINYKLVEILAKVGSHISAKLSDYPILKRLCLEGTRTQSKFAVSAIASVIDGSEQSVLPELCEELVKSLESGRNIPTVLQALGCIAQHSVSTFEAQNQRITSYIYENIFQVEPSEEIASFDETSGCSASCKLKIYALKTIVKSFLPHHGSQVRQQINELFDILSKMLQKGDAFPCNESDKAYINLAAAKSVLRLSRKWDLHISPEIFRYTMLMAKDSSPFVRRQFLQKTRKLLKQRVIPRRYACAFALATSDCLKDLQADSFKYLAEFIKDYSKQARIQQTSAMPGGAITDHPAYIVVFLIHVLAHDAGFPPEDCQDEEIFAQFCGPLFLLVQSLVNVSTVDGNKDPAIDAVPNLTCIFRAIKRADDAIDTQNTPKLHVLSEIGISTVNALNHNGVSSHTSPGLIFLPSSLYRISVSKRSKEANLKCPARFTLDERFFQRVVHVLKSQICLPATTLSKRGRKCKEDGTESNAVKRGELNLTLCKQINLSTTGKIETCKNSVRQEANLGHRRKRALSPPVVASVRQEANLGHRRKRALSPPVVASVGLRECSTVEKFMIDSSCNSVTAVLALPETQDSDKSAVPSQENVGANNSVTAKLSKYPRGKDSCHSKITYDGGQVELMCLDSESLDTVSDNSQADRIMNDGGQVELMCLDSESLDTVSDNSQLDRDTILADASNLLRSWHCDIVEHSSLSSVDETVNKHVDIAAQRSKGLLQQEIGKFSSNVIPQPGRKKGQKASSESLASKVVNTKEEVVVRRTRRQRV